jgi:ElaB/YqjD/DUF883 family membrane-anchored ribosome-binding protein
MTKKLQNIKAVQQMLDGEHKFQTKKTVGFSDAKNKAEHREIGDTWEETDTHGNAYIVEQRDGFRIRKTKNSDLFQSVRDELQAFPNCRKETCTCVGTHQLDQKMRKIHGMCFDCVIEMEHELKKAGKYEEYEQEKIRENALAWLRDAERDVEMLKQAYTQVQQIVANSDGHVEHWSAKMTAEEFENTIQKQFEEFKINFLANLNKKEKHNENN